MSTHYETIGVEPDTPRDEIRDAYRARVAELDAAIAEPKRRDRQALREEKARLNEAWTVLADPYQRGRYDRNLAEETRADERDDVGASPATTEKLTLRERMRPRSGESGRTQGSRAPDPDAAPVLRRVGAALMDVVVMAGMYLAAFSVVASIASPGEEGGALVAVIVVGVVLLGAYNIVPVARTGQTLGKRLMKVRVVDAESRGPVTPRVAVRRYAIPVVLASLGAQLPVMLALLLGLSFLFAQNRVSLLDRLARTRVVAAE